jgi:hypothetical protein
MALDPGKMTGWAMLDRQDGVFSSGEMEFLEMCDFIAQQANTHKAELVLVAESFIIGPQTIKNTQAPWSLEMIGVIRYFSQRYTGRDLVLQAPASAKRFASDARLKHMGWHKPGKGHANDASRHLLTVLANRGWLATDELRKLAEVVG